MTLVTEVAALEPVRIEHLHRHGHTVLRLVGDLRRDTVAGVGRAITTALIDAGSVLVDLDGVQIDHASRSLVFTVALDQAGGWLRARLVLYGGTPALVRALDAFRITKTVPYAPTLPEALIKIAMQPPRVRCGVTLEPQPDAPGRARALLHEAGAAWGIPAPNAGKARVVLGELVASAVERAETCHAVVEFDGARVWVSVSDLCAGIRRLRPRDLWAGGRGRGQRDAIALADKWGVEYLRDTHKVWAVIAGDSSHSAGSAGYGVIAALKTPLNARLGQRPGYCGRGAPSVSVSALVLSPGQLPSPRSTPLLNRPACAAVTCDRALRPHSCSPSRSGRAAATTPATLSGRCSPRIASVARVTRSASARVLSPALVCTSVMNSSSRT